MNPGLVVKLRPSGPWRIGPDSGARNRVDVIYHSDTLYSAVTAAMSRLGWLEEWLEATARTASPAVSFSSCFPYLGDVLFIVPPRTVWPPASPSTRAERIRWRSARFVPLSVVQSVLDGKRLDENQWSVDGPSDCLVPAGQPGPFRTAVRSSAAVDRLTGTSERHSVACLEFRSDSGLWTVVSFADETAQEHWSERVKAAFRLLADSGFGGERSRGWGRSEAPDFIDGMLPDLILPLPVAGAAAKPEPVEVAEAVVAAPPVVEPLIVEPEAPKELAPEVSAPEVVSAEAGTELSTEPVADTPGDAAPSEEAPVMAAAAAAEAPAPVAEPVAAAPEPVVEPEIAPPPAVEAVVEEAPAAEPAAEAEPLIPAGAPSHPHWLLSLFTPAASDSVDWGRGNYTVLPRGGRIDSPAGAGELKKQIQMVAEGSVLYSEAPPRGSAADVAPDGFAHPVFRAGFAVAIPLPEVR